MTERPITPAEWLRRERKRAGLDMRRDPAALKTVAEIVAVAAFGPDANRRPEGRRHVDETDRSTERQRHRGA